LYFWGIGVQWRRDVAFAGFEVPIQMDISAEKMIFGVAGIDPERSAVCGSLVLICMQICLS
jgi:hypothetical protein